MLRDRYAVSTLMPVHSSVQQAHNTPIALDSIAVISGGQSLGLALYCLDLNQPAGLPQ